MMALTQNQPQYQPGFEDFNTSLSGCVDLYGVHDFTDHQQYWSSRDNGFFKGFIQKAIVQKSMKRDFDEFAKASPVHLLKNLKSQQIPPILGIHGNRDTLVPIEDAVYFYDALKVHLIFFFF